MTLPDLPLCHLQKIYYKYILKKTCEHESKEYIHMMLGDEGFDVPIFYGPIIKLSIFKVSIL